MPRGAMDRIAPARWPRPRRSHVGSIELGIAEDDDGARSGTSGGGAEVATAGTGHATPRATNDDEKRKCSGAGRTLEAPVLLLVRYARGWALHDLHGVDATRVRSNSRWDTRRAGHRRSLPDTQKAPRRFHRAGMRRFIKPKRTFRRTRRSAAPRSGMPRRRERRCCA